MSNNPDYSDALLTEIQAATHLNLSSRTLQAWRIKQVGPSFVRAGRAIRYRLSDLRQWLNEQTVKTVARNRPANSSPSR